MLLRNIRLLLLNVSARLFVTKYMTQIYIFSAYYVHSNSNQATSIKSITAEWQHYFKV